MMTLTGGVIGIRIRRKRGRGLGMMLNGRKHRSSRSKKPSSSGDIYESQKRLSDEDHCDLRRDAQSKHLKRDKEEGSLEKFST